MKNDVITPFHLGDFVFRVAMVCLVMLLLLSVGWSLSQFLYLIEVWEKTESMR